MGLEDLTKSLGGLGGLGDKLDLDNFKLDELFNDTFIAKNTTLKTVKEFIDKSGFDVNSILDFKNLPVDKLDVFVKSISSFGSWKDMLAKAVQGVAGGKLGGLF
jgi:hypothetical protein